MSEIMSRLILGTAGIDLARSRRVYLKALEAAWEQGISHFDTAPIYAHGQAEVILGEFFKRHPEAHVTTKAGLSGKALPKMPASLFRLMRLAYRLAGRRERPAVAGPKPAGIESPLAAIKPFDSAAAQKSLEMSLGRLGRDSVDVLLLHETHPFTANTAEAMEFVNQALSTGKAGQVGIGGNSRSWEGCTLNPAYRVLQTEFFLGSPAWPKSAPGSQQVMYSVLRPLGDIRQRIESPSEARRWQSSLDSSLTGDESLAVWLMSWALNAQPKAQAIFFSSSAVHICEMSQGVQKLMRDPQRLTVFENLSRSLSPA